MKRITVKKVMSWGPCYSQSWVEERFAGRKSVTAQGVANCEMDMDDRLWVLCHMLNTKDAILLACAFASRAVRRKGALEMEDRKTLLDILKVARAVADGRRDKACFVEQHKLAEAIESRSRRNAARAAASTVACVVDDDDAWANLWSAAADAARTARSTCEGGQKKRDAAYDAEEVLQVGFLVELINR